MIYDIFSKENAIITNLCAPNNITTSLSPSFSDLLAIPETGQSNS